MPDLSVKQIPFGPVLETSGEEIAGSAPEAFNVLVDARGVLRKRPGIGAYSVAPATSVDAGGVLGLYVTEDQVAHTTGTDTVSGTHPGILYAVGATVNASGGGHNAGRNVYRIVGGAATIVGTGAANEDRLATPAAGATARTPRPVFAETESLLVIAGGAEVAKIDIRSETFSSPNFTNPNPTYNQMSFLGGCPPLATHVIANSSRILANDTQLDHTKVRYSDISQGIVDFSGHETWVPSPGAAGFFTAEARSDSIVAIAENTNEVWAFGKTSLQLFSPDGANTYSPSVTKEIGCSARYGLCKWDDHYIFVDHLTRIVKSDGRDWDDIGAPIQATLLDLTTPSDCYAYRFSESVADCLVFRFEADSVTLVYQDKVGWAKWAVYDADHDTFTKLPVLSHLLRPDGGLNVVGMEDGTIRLLSLDLEDDLGVPIVSYVTTGFVDHNTDHLKKVVAVRMVFKRNLTISDGVAGFLEYRDELSSEWTSLEIDLGVGDGDLSPVVTFRSVGIYRRRQYRLRWAHRSPMALVRATEEVEIQDS